MPSVDPLADLLVAVRREARQDDPQPQPATVAQVFGESAAQEVTARSAAYPFDLDVVAVRHCRYPCDLPWHRHDG